MTIHTLISSIIVFAACIAATSCGKGGNDVNAANAPATTHAPKIVFSSDSAYRFVAEQVAFGPRVAGTGAHSLCHDYLVDKLKGYGAEVELQDTTYGAPGQKAVAVRNILGRFNPSAQRQVLLLAHYDTRPWADKDPDPANHTKPLDGANDGASGVGILLEIGRQASLLPKNIGLQILFVDAEDAGSYGPDDDRSWCVGSQAWVAAGNHRRQNIAYAILLDMVGAKDATFCREYFSELAARQLNDRIFQTADMLGYGDRFHDYVGGAVNDDHFYLIEAGIPAVDIIECAHADTQSFNPTWHTMADNLSNIDPATLKAVGDVVIATITR